MKKTKKRQQQFRTDDDLDARIRKGQQKIQKNIGMKISFAAAIRFILEKGLEAL